MIPEEMEESSAFLFVDQFRRAGRIRADAFFAELEVFWASEVFGCFDRVAGMRIDDFFAWETQFLFYCRAEKHLLREVS